MKEKVMDEKFNVIMPVYVDDIPYLIENNTKCCHKFVSKNTEPCDYKYCPIGSFSCPFQTEYYSDEICKTITKEDWKEFFHRFMGKIS